MNLPQINYLKAYIQTKWYKELFAAFSIQASKQPRLYIIEFMASNNPVSTTCCLHGKAQNKLLIKQFKKNEEIIQNTKLQHELYCLFFSFSLISTVWRGQFPWHDIIHQFNWAHHTTCECQKREGIKNAAEYHSLLLIIMFCGECYYMGPLLVPKWCNQLFAWFPT